MNTNADPLHLERKISKAHSQLWNNLSLAAQPQNYFPLLPIPSRDTAESTSIIDVVNL